jgi:hypothetical protein
MKLHLYNFSDPPLIYLICKSFSINPFILCSAYRRNKYLHPTELLELLLKYFNVLFLDLLTHL